MQNYRTNPNYSRSTSYYDPMDMPYKAKASNGTSYHHEAMDMKYNSNINPTVETGYQRPVDPGYQHPGVSPSEELRDLPRAMAYVPFTKWENMFAIDESLSKGTMFQELYKPFLGGQCNAQSRY